VPGGHEPPGDDHPLGRGGAPVVDHADHVDSAAGQRQVGGRSATRAGPWPGPERAVADGVAARRSATYHAGGARARALPSRRRRWRARPRSVAARLPEPRAARRAAALTGTNAAACSRGELRGGPARPRQRAEDAVEAVEAARHHVEGSVECGRPNGVAHLVEDRAERRRGEPQTGPARAVVVQACRQAGVVSARWRCPSRRGQAVSALPKRPGAPCARALDRCPVEAGVGRHGDVLHVRRGQAPGDQVGDLPPPRLVVKRTRRQRVVRRAARASTRPSRSARGWKVASRAEIVHPLGRGTAGLHRGVERLGASWVVRVRRLVDRARRRAMPGGRRAVGGHRRLPPPRAAPPVRRAPARQREIASAPRGPGSARVARVEDRWSAARSRRSAPGPGRTTGWRTKTFGRSLRKNVGGAA
jgi:hypothetical protein